jgi:hypothetical protein
MVRPLLAVAIACASLAACSVPSPRPGTDEPTTASPSVSAVPVTVADEASGISFGLPAGWTRWQPNGHSPMTDGPLIYLSTDPLLPACAVAPSNSPNPPDARGRACDAPVASLRENGVFVSWVTSRTLERLPSEGEAIAINGSTGRLEVERPGSCGAIGADETIAVLVPIGQPTPLSNIAVVACLRGPDLATAEAHLRAMLASVTIAP